jgi:hypothetical protein
MLAEKAESVLRSYILQNVDSRPGGRRKVSIAVGA